MQSSVKLGQRQTFKCKRLPFCTTDYVDLRWRLHSRHSPSLGENKGKRYAERYGEFKRVRFLKAGKQKFAVSWFWEGLVRWSGFEPPRYCYRQPLKLVRLPIPPRPRGKIVSCEDRLCQTAGNSFLPES